MKRLTVSVILVCGSILLDSTGVAQSHWAKIDPVKYGEVKLNGRYFKNYLIDTKDLLISPLRWKSRDWIKASLVAGATLVIWNFDEEINQWVAANSTKTTGDLANAVEPMGNDRYLLPVATMIPLFAYGALGKNYKAKRASLLGLESYVITGLFTQILKHTIRRQRPYESNDSFPSGHSSSVFSIASVVASVYKDTKWVPPVVYSLASLTAISRLHNQAHWASDIFFGSAMGFFVGKSLVRFHQDKPSNLTFIPVVSSEASSIALLYQF